MLEQKNYLLRRLNFQTKLKIEFYLLFTSNCKVLANIPAHGCSRTHKPGASGMYGIQFLGVILILMLPSIIFFQKFALLKAV